MTNFFEFSKSTGRMVIADKTAPGTPILLDTDHGTIYTPDGLSFSASINIPARSVSSSGVDGSQGTINTQAEYYVGTPILASANMVRGLIRFDGVSDNNLWRDAKGSHLEHHDAVSITTKPQTDLVGKYFLATQRIITPMINNLGHLVLHERVVSRPRDPGSPPAITKTIPALTVLCRLHCDFWHGNPLIVPRPDVEFRGFGGSSATPGNVSVPAGYSYPGRRVIAAIATRDGGAVTSASIGGVAATIHDTQLSGTIRVTIVSAIVPSGDPLTVTAAYAATPSMAWVQLFAVRGVGNGVPATIKTQMSSGSSAALGMTVGSNQVAVVVCAGIGGGSCSWSGASEALDGGGLSFFQAYSAIIDNGPGATTATATFASAVTQFAMIAAVFST